MITDEDHPQMILAHQALVQRLGRVLGNGHNNLTLPFLERCYEVVKDHREHWRKEGVDFPRMVALVVPRLGILEFKRADLEMQSIAVSIVNFYNDHTPRGVTMEEIVLAFRVAYPHLKPDDVLQTFKNAADASAARAIRRAEIAKEAERIVREESNGSKDAQGD